MSSIVITTADARAVASPAVGLGVLEPRPYPGSGLVAGMRPANCGPVIGASLVAPVQETGLPTVLGADAPIQGTGLPATVRGIRVRQSAVDFHTIAVAFTAATVQRKSSTPGDQPPEDPLS